MSGVASSKPGQRRDLLEPGELVQHELHLGERARGMWLMAIAAASLTRCARYLSAAVSSGMIWNRSPTRP